MTNEKEVKIPLKISELKAGQEIEVPVQLSDDEENLKIKFSFVLEK